MSEYAEAGIKATEETALRKEMREEATIISHFYF